MQIPRLTKSGNYDPQELQTYLQEARGSGRKPHQICADLRITIDRYHYLIGDGAKPIFKELRR